jgi:hypothetical protein
MSAVVRKIIKKLGVKRKREEVERKEEKEDDPDIEQQQQQQQPDLQQKEDCPAYTPGSYVVAVYQSDWYAGQILDKDGEPEAEGWGDAGLRIRIQHFSNCGSGFRIWIPDPDTGFDDLKLKKIYSWKLISIFLIKNCNLLIPRPP